MLQDCYIECRLCHKALPIDMVRLMNVFSSDSACLEFFSANCPQCEQKTDYNSQGPYTVFSMESEYLSQYPGCRYLAIYDVFEKEASDEQVNALDCFTYEDSPWLVFDALVAKKVMGELNSPCDRAQEIDPYPCYRAEARLLQRQSRDLLRVLEARIPSYAYQISVLDAH